MNLKERKRVPLRGGPVVPVEREEATASGQTARRRPECGKADARTGGSEQDEVLGRLHGTGIRHHPAMSKPAVPSERRS